MTGGGTVAKSIVALVLAGLAVGLGQGAWWLHSTPADTSPLVADGQQASWTPDLGGKTGNEFVARALEDFSDTLERPLFEPERRRFFPKPPEPEPVAKAPEPEPPPPAPEKPRERLRIAGVKIFNGKRQALIIVESSNETRWVSSGDSIGGWKVVSIDDAGAEVSAGTTRRKVMLYVDKR